MLFQRLKEYKENKFSWFHMPGHKGNFGIDLKFDVTELDCTDDLYDSVGPIKKSEALISRIYGSGLTVFSAQGNTLCIQAMLHLAVPFGGKVIVARNCHKSVVNAIGLLGLDVIWVNVESRSNVSFKDIKLQIDKNPDVKAVFVTSPDYFGAMADIKKIKSVCNDIPLLVDNAHGSHLIFFDKHPISLGADICADSAHKTLPVLTGGAWMHVSKSFAEKRKIGYTEAKRSMQVFGSTSPSFLILVSLEKCALWMKLKGKKKFYELHKNVEDIRAKYGYIIYETEIYDPVRVVFDTSSIGILSKDFNDYLEKFKIKAEFNTDTRTVLIPTPFNSVQDWDRLYLALEKLDVKSKIIYKHEDLPVGKYIISVRDAMFREYVVLGLDDSLNRISAETICKCPPGIPIVIPGELITSNAIEIMRNNDVKYIEVLRQ